MVEKHPLGALWPTLAEPFRAFGARLADWMAPASDARSDAEAYRITMELPGVAEADIEITAEAGTLSVSGEKRATREEKGDTWFFSERQYGAFQRSFRLPADADEGAIRAALKDGLLTLTVPRKASASPTGRKVTVERG
jgi:HSP20 family protein